VTSHSKVIINACRPFEWIDKFPATIALSPDEAQAALKKFHDALKKPTRT
jgi:4-hydroxy-3-polyprenylbenzoate decarboxylase